MTDKSLKSTRKKSLLGKALRDFHLYQPPKIDIMIKKGDDLDDAGIPERLLENLLTEQVMKG